MIYAWSYLVFFTILLLLYVLFKKSKVLKTNNPNRYEIIALLLYLIFYGLRGYILTDWPQYVDLYESLGRNQPLGWNQQFEPGYILLNVLLKPISDDYFFFQFVMTLIDVTGLYVILKRENKTYFLFAFALLIPFFDVVQINLMRNIKAILIFYYSIKYIREKNFKFFLLSIILATTLHVSSLIMMPFYFFINKKMGKTLAVMFVISLVIYFIGLGELTNILVAFGNLFGGNIAAKTNDYMINDVVDAGFTFGFFFRLFLGLALLCYYKSLSAKNQIMLNLALLYIISAMMFNSALVIRDRLACWFSIGVICILPYLFDIIRKKPSYPIIISFCFVCLYGQIYVQHNSSIAGYENVLIGISNRGQAMHKILNLKDRQ